MNWICLALVVLCSGWIVLGLLGVIWSKLAPRGGLLPLKPWSEPITPITVLKPLCGVDPGLAENLESFFVQDHGEYELVFGVENPRDPALAVLDVLQAKHPDVRVHRVVHSGGRAINPKVRNLLGMLPYASHDLVVISDSNVRAPKHYIRELAEAYASSERVGLVTNVFVGKGERSLGAALECVQLNGFCAAGTTLPTLLGDSLVVGKSLLFSRAVLETLGGLSRVADILAEDFVLGKLFQHAGYKVVIAPTVLETHVGQLSLLDFMKRHLRWAMLRWRLRPLAALLEVVTSPVAVLPCALELWGSTGFFWAFGLLTIRDVGGWIVLRGLGNLWLPLILAPLRDALLLLVWALGPMKRHIRWRGNRVRLAMGTLLFKDGPGLG